MSRSGIKRRLFRGFVAALGLAAVIAALDLTWRTRFVVPRVERFPDPIEVALKNGQTPRDYHYEVAYDLIDHLPSADFETPNLAKAADKLKDRMDARPNPRLRHVLARLASLGSSSNYRQSLRSIHLPPPGRVSFRVDVPNGAILRGWIGIPAEQEAPVTFLATADGVEIFRRKEMPLPRFPYNESGWFYKNVYRHWSVELKDHEARWTPFEVDLSSRQGKTIELTLRTESESGSAVQAFFGAPAVLAKADGPPRPVIVYLADAFNVEYCGAYGSDSGLTPRIDAFAKEGARVESFIAGGNWSRSGVTTMLTRLPVPRLYLPTTPSKRRLNPAVRELFEGTGIETAATLFRKGRYRTIAVVNNIFVDPSSRVGVDLGFDSLTQTLRPDLSTMDVEQFVSRALAEHRDENVLLYIHQSAPNTADEPPSRFRKIAKPAWKERGRYGVFRYLACLAQADFTFGRFLDALARLGWDRDATLLFSSDHGQVLSAAHEIRTPDGPDSMRRALYFHGQTLYDEELRVPLIVRGPGIAHGLTLRGQYPSLTVLPTLLDLAGLPDPGVSTAPGLADVLRGRSAESRASMDAVVSFGKDSSCVRVENRYKYILWTNPRRLLRAGSEWIIRAVQEELFDLQSDPGEKTNLAATRPELLSRMRAVSEKHTPEWNKVWALFVPKGAADEVRIEGAVRLANAAEGIVPPDEDGNYTVRPTGDASFAAFPKCGSDFKAVLLKNGAPLPRQELRFGPAFKLPPSEDGYTVKWGSTTAAQECADIPPDPEGVAHPHLCLMSYEDWVAQTPESGSMDTALKDLLKKWGYVQ